MYFLGPIWSKPPPGKYDSKAIPEDMLPDSLVYTLQATAGDGSDNISYSFLKQTPDKPELFDLSYNLVKVLPDAELDIDTGYKPTMYILHFRFVYHPFPGEQTTLKHALFKVMTLNQR